MARPTISRKPRIIDGFDAKQSAALFALFARNDDTIQQLAQLDASVRVYTTDTVARAGQFLRASPPDSRGMALLLPSPDSTQPGDTISVSLEGPLGDLRVSCVPNQGNGARVTLGTVNGQERATFTTAGHIVFTSNGATGWTTAAEHPAESAAAPSITPASSVEILPSNPSGSIWTWALRPFSVALGRLAKQVGLTVLGNASDALAQVAAITATAARQALLVNSTGTAIGWRALEGADLPATSPYGWDDVLANDATSGANDPIVSSGRFMQFGAVGPTTNSPQIRSGDTSFRIAGSGSLTELSSAAQVRLTGAATGVNAAMSWVLGGVARWTIAGNGEWTTPAGTSGQFWKHNGAAFPIWASLALSDLPSQAADTFLGRLAGAGTPAAQLFSDIDSTSIIYDATSHTFQRAAFTSEVTAGQNANALTVTRSTNFQSSPWTGQHEFDDHVYFNSTYVGFGAKAGIDAMSVGDIRKAGDLTIIGSNGGTGVLDLVGGTATQIRNGLSSCVLRMENDGTSGAVFTMPASRFVTVDSTVGLRLITGGALHIGETSSSSITVASGFGMFWVRNGTPSLPMFTGDTNVDVPIQNGFGTETAKTTVTNSTTVIDLTNGVSIPANTLVAGSRWTGEAVFKFTRGSTATALALNASADLGANSLAVAATAGAAGALTTNGATGTVRVVASFTIDTTGAAGSARAEIMTFTNCDQTTQTGVVRAATATWTVNTTIANTWKLRGQMGTAVANCTIIAQGGNVRWET